VSRPTELVTRYVRADMTAHNGFTWPSSGPVSCPDWDPAPKCGNGLHGWLHGRGDAKAWDHCDGDLMLVVEVDAASIVDLNGKVKFPAGAVVYCGDAAGMSAVMAAAGYTSGLINGTAIAGYGGTATAGIRGTATAGDYGTAIAGDYGTAIAGIGGTAIAGVRGIVCIRWFDHNADRYRLTIGYVGEDGIEPNTPYKCDDSGKLYEVKS